MFKYSWLLLFLGDMFTYPLLFRSCVYISVVIGVVKESYSHNILFIKNCALVMFFFVLLFRSCIYSSVVIV